MYGFLFREAGGVGEHLLWCAVVRCCVLCVEVDIMRMYVGEEIAEAGWGWGCYMMNLITR